MEPFYQLQRQGGATAENSLFLDYATSSFITTPFKALSRRHYVVLSSSLISLAAMAIATLSSETFFVSLSGNCGPKAVGNCYATWGIYTLLARVIEALLALIAILTTLIIISGVRRGSGVFANPLSIIGLGTLINHPDILREFRAIDSLASLSKLKQKLAGLKFRLLMGFTDNDQCYGITVVSDGRIRGLDNSLAGNSSATNLLSREHDGLYGVGQRYLEGGNSRPNLAGMDDLEGSKRLSDNDDEMPNSREKTRKAHPQKVFAGRTALMGLRTRTETGVESDESLADHRRDWWSITERILYVSAFASLGGLIAMIIYYQLHTVDNNFTQFLGSESFGVRLTMTIVGILVKLFFAHVDEGKSEPFPFTASSA